MDNLIHNVSIEWKKERHSYSSLCGRWGSECFENKFLDLGLIMDQIENKSIRLSYPVMLNPETYNSHSWVLHFGGIKLSNDSYSVEEVRAVNLIYFLAIDNDEDDDR